MVSLSLSLASTDQFLCSLYEIEAKTNQSRFNCKNTLRKSTCFEFSASSTAGVSVCIRMSLKAWMKRLYFSGCAPSFQYRSQFTRSSSICATYFLANFAGVGAAFGFCFISPLYLSFATCYGVVASVKWFAALFFLPQSVFFSYSIKRENWVENMIFFMINQFNLLFLIGTTIRRARGEIVALCACARDFKEVVKYAYFMRATGTWHSFIRFDEIENR